MTKTFTPEQWEEFLSRDDWKRRQDQEVTDTFSRDEEEWNEETEELELLEVPHSYGWAMITSELDGVTITYTEGFNYDLHMPDTLTSGTEGMDKVWTVSGAVIIDEDGDESDPRDWLDSGSDFAGTNYDFLTFDETEDTDMTDKDAAITLRIDNAPSLRFNGERVASVSSSADTAHSSYSGSTGRWTELELYKTTGGKFVCYQIGRTQWQGEHDRYKGQVCQAESDVIVFFGHGWLAKELYAEAGIEDVVEVD